MKIYTEDVLVAAGPQPDSELETAALLVRRDGPVAWLTLNRPAENNAINFELAYDFARAITVLDTDPTCSVIMITGSGRAFSTGGDVSSMAASVDRVDYITEIASVMGDALEVLAQTSKIVVSVINGVTAGAGLAFALNADIVIAAKTATFLSAYATVGLTPDCGVSSRLPEIIGRRRALEFCLTGRVLRAAEALEWQLVTQVVDRDDLLPSAERLATALSRKSARALSETKRLLRADVTDREGRNRDEVETLGTMAATADTIRRIDALGTKPKAA